MKENRTYVLEHNCSVLCSRTQNRAEHGKFFGPRTQNRTEHKTKIGLEQRLEQEHELDYLTRTRFLFRIFMNSVGQRPPNRCAECSICSECSGCSTFEPFARYELFDLLAVLLFEIFAKSKVFGLFSIWTVRCAESGLKLTVRNGQNGNAKEDDTVSSGNS